MGIVCMAMIANLQYGWTLFVDPIDAKNHWGRAAIQLAFTIFVVTETWLVRSKPGSSTNTARGPSTVRSEISFRPSLVFGTPKWRTFLARVAVSARRPTGGGHRGDRSTRRAPHRGEVRTRLVRRRVRSSSLGRGETTLLEKRLDIRIPAAELPVGFRSIAGVARRKDVLAHSVGGCLVEDVARLGEGFARVGVHHLRPEIAVVAAE